MHWTLGKSRFALWLIAAFLLTFAPAEAQTIRTESGIVRGVIP